MRSVEKRSLPPEIVPELPAGLGGSDEEKGEGVLKCHVGACR